MTTSTSNAIGTFVKELEEQALITKSFLELVPEDKYDWQPHPKSMKMISLATHIAELPGWVDLTLTTEELDFETAPYEETPIAGNSDLLDHFERSLEKGHAALMATDEEELEKQWTLRSGDKIHSVSTKAEMIRITYNQIVHHRAQLGVYFRLLDIPVPQSFGPTADHSDF